MFLRGTIWTLFRQSFLAVLLAVVCKFLICVGFTVLLTTVKVNLIIWSNAAVSLASIYDSSLVMVTCMVLVIAASSLFYRDSERDLSHVTVVGVEVGLFSESLLVSGFLVHTLWLSAGKSVALGLVGDWIVCFGRGIGLADSGGADERGYNLHRTCPV